MTRLAILALATALAAPPAMSQPTDGFGSENAARFVALALTCVHQEYPNKIAHVMHGDGDARAPRALTPIFYGCFDWHSAVHGHWLLVRSCRTWPRAAFVGRCRAALAKSFTRENAEAEVRYLEGKGRRSFERPYGLAWLLQLSAELHEWKDEEAQEWSRVIEPLEAIAVARFKEWLPKLSHPIRTGEHSQTAFAFGLVLDWARSRGDREMEDLVVSRSRHYYAKDRGWPLAFEPSGQDFLSPGLAEADLMRRILEPAEFAAWLGVFLPDIVHGDAGGWLPPAVVTDKSDGKLAHLDGLNLSRAWMLDGIEAGLPRGDPRRPALRACAAAHRAAGLPAVTGSHYEGGHWLGSFAVYLVTRRGL